MKYCSEFNAELKWINNRIWQSISITIALLCEHKYMNMSPAIIVLPPSLLCFLHSSSCTGGIRKHKKTRISTYIPCTLFFNSATNLGSTSHAITWKKNRFQRITKIFGIVQSTLGQFLGQYFNFLKYVRFFYLFNFL